MLLHQDVVSNMNVDHRSEITVNVNKISEITSESSTMNSCLQKEAPTVHLSAAIALAGDVYGNPYECRCLLDVSSPLNLISDRMYRI